MRKNVLEVILNTTVMPFRWLKSLYRCFYCYEVFDVPANLKEHQSTHTIDNEKVKFIKNYSESTVYVDVSCLSCNLCTIEVENFDDLIDHLIEIHEIPYNRNISDCMSPFRLNEITVQCVQCPKEFSAFNNLLHHTANKHNGELKELCELCGQHFGSKIQLRHHANKEHGKNVCNLCGDKMISITKMRTHMQNVHNKKYKCSACDELFDSMYKRTRHMMLVHKSRDEIKCEYCSKTYVFRSAMISHVRQMHLNDMKMECSICGFKALYESKIRRHMARHSDEKNVKCLACDKRFKMKKTMIRHYNNIHGGKKCVQDIVNEEC